jgi:phosphatidylinositol alpha-mannosyltransferase
VASHNLKIALVTDDGLDRADGVQQQVKLLASWLKAQGHTVIFLAGETSSKTINDNPVYSLSKNFSISANQNQLTLPRPVPKKRIQDIFIREKFDIVHVMLPYSPFLGAKVVKIALARNIPLIGTFHTHPASKLQIVGSKIYGQYLKPTLNKFKFLTTVSEPTRQYVIKSFGVDCQVIPNFVELSRFKNGSVIEKLRTNRYTIIFMNRLVKRKGPQYLLAALAELKSVNKLNDIHTYICGKGPLLDKLKQQVTTSGIADNVTFTGFVDETEKPDYLTSADLAIYPATTGEAFGIVLIESMGAGTLTLGGDNPGYRSVLKRSELIINPLDSKAFANRIHRLLHETTLRGELLSWQANEIVKYDIAYIGPIIEKLYQKAT